MSLQDHIIVVELYPRRLDTGETEVMRAYAGDPMRFRGAPWPADATLLDISGFARSIVDTSQGYPIVGGVAIPEAPTIVLSNASGQYEGLAREYSFDGARCRILDFAIAWDRETQRPGLVELSKAEVWLDGQTRGRPRVTDEQVTIAVGDLTDALRVDVRSAELLGLGGCLTLPGKTGTYAEIPATSPDPLDAMTEFAFSMLVRWDGGAAALAPFFLAKGGSGDSPWWVRLQAAGQLRVKVHTDAGSQQIDTPALVQGAWYWIAARYDGVELRVYWANVDGTPAVPDGAGGYKYRASSKLLTGTVVTTAHPLTFGKAQSGNAAECSIAHWRFWEAAIDEGHLTDTFGRLLDPEDPDDSTGLYLHVPMDERFGDVIADVRSGRDGTLIGWSNVDDAWSTTATGRPDQADQKVPLTTGFARSVPLRLVDNLPTGSVWSANFRPVDRWLYLTVGGVALAPPYDQDLGAGVTVDAGQRRVLAPAALPEGLVPDMEVSIDIDGAGPSTYTISRIGADRFWVVEPIGSATSTTSCVIQAVSPGWQDRGDGTVLVTGQASGKLLGWLRGDAGGPGGYTNRLDETLHLVLTEMGPKVPEDDLDLSGLGAAAGDLVCLHLGAGAVPAYDAADRLVRSVGGHLTANGSGQLSAGVIDPDDPGPPVATFQAAEVYDLEVAELGVPPTDLVIGYQPAFGTLDESEIYEAALEFAADFSRRPFRTLEAPAANVEDWPSAVKSQPVQTLLVKAVAAKAHAYRWARIAQGPLYRCSLPPEALAVPLGSKVRVYGTRHGLQAGKDLWLVDIEPQPLLGRVQVTLLEIPE